MSNGTRKAFSWSLSVFFHSAIAVAVLYTGARMMFPEGHVNGEQITIETYQAPKGEPVEVKPQVQPEEKPAPQDVVVKKVEPKHVKPAVAKAPPPKFMPDKSFNDVQPADKTPEDDSADEKPLETVEESPVVTKAEEKPAPSPEPVAEEKSEPVPEPVAQQAPEPEPAPVQAEEAPKPVVQQAPVAPAPADPAPAVSNAKAGDPKGTASEVPPKFGTPGTTLDESKLTEIRGRISYPWMARLRRQQGTVIIKAFVRKDGSILQPSLERSSGFPLLDQEALTAYSQWRYKPGPSGWVIKTFNFNLLADK